MVNTHIRESRLSIPFNAPKHEKATMNAKTVPPTGPKRARPKSMATVLLSPTVAWSPDKTSESVDKEIPHLVQHDKIRNVREEK